MNLLRHFSIAKRLTLGFGLLALMLVILGSLSLAQVAVISQRIDEVTQDLMPKQKRLQHMGDEVDGIASAMRDMLLLTSGADVQDQRNRIFAGRAIIQKQLAELDPTLKHPEGRRRLAEVHSGRQAFVASQDRFLAAMDSGDAALARGILLRESRALQQAYMDKVQALSAFQDERTAVGVREVDAAVSTVQVVTAAAVGAGLLLAVLFARSSIRSVTRPMARAVAVAHAVAEGDLTLEIDVQGRDETAELMRALAHMQHHLAQVVGTVRCGAEGVATASAQMAQGNADLSGRTEQQASALEETAASMEQLGSSARLNADHARQANQLASSASDVARQGGEVVGQVVQTMKDINDSSRQIADIIGVIDGIAFQTNILALNAAVEAARAGEQGRGFAVVAGEVRNLAQRAAAAAKEIRGLIMASVDRVEQGSALVDQAGSTMQAVVSSITRVRDIVGEISSASAEQDTGVGQVSQAVSHMDQATQQNAALVEESAAAAASLRSQAEALVRAVAVFRLDRSAQA